jgi:hypothetical protein
MSNVYVEPRPKGRPEGTPIVQDHADHVLQTFKRSNRLGQEEWSYTACRPSSTSQR